jgi:hypothetical protein
VDNSVKKILGAAPLDIIREKFYKIITTATDDLSTPGGHGLAKN